MKIAFVRVAEQHDRVYVQRTDGSEVSWTFPTYGSYIPHDLVHLVVETAFGVKHGFWGRADAGVDVARINQIANRMGGANKYAAFGVDQYDLQIAEFLAAQRWGDATVPSSEIAATILRTFPHLAPVTDAKIEAIRNTIDRLCRIWMALLPKGTLHAHFDPDDLPGSFENLGKD